MATEVNAGGSALPAPESALPATPEVRLGALLDEAQAAVSVSANTLRDVRERYRVAHRAEVNRWESLRADLAPVTPDKPHKNGRRQRYARPAPQTPVVGAIKGSGIEQG